MKADGFDNRKKCTLLFQVKIIGWRLVSDQLFVVKASLD